MTTRGQGMAALLVGAGLAVATATGAGAQQRPEISFAESAGGSGPVCVVGNVVSDCAGGPVARPVLVGNPGVLILPGVRPVPAFVVGGHGAVVDSSDVDVSRTTRTGTEVAR